MNVKVGYIEMEVVGKRGVEGVNENGHYLLDNYVEMGQFLANTFNTSWYTSMHVQGRRRGA